MLPGYLDEPGIRPGSETETFVAIKAQIDNWRWAGVPFYLRTGKRMQERLAEIVVSFGNISMLPQHGIDTDKISWDAFRKDDAATRNAVENAFECMKLDGTMAKLHEKWFGVKPEKGSAAVTVFPGYGVPGMDGHDPKAHKPNCK